MAQIQPELNAQTEEVVRYELRSPHNVLPFTGEWQKSEKCEHKTRVVQLPAEKIWM